MGKLVGQKLKAAILDGWNVDETFQCTLIVCNFVEKKEIYAFRIRNEKVCLRVFLQLWGSRKPFKLTYSERNSLDFIKVNKVVHYKCWFQNLEVQSSYKLGNVFGFWTTTHISRYIQTSGAKSLQTEDITEDSLFRVSTLQLSMSFTKFVKVFI